MNINEKSFNYKILKAFKNLKKFLFDKNSLFYTFCLIPSLIFLYYSQKIQIKSDNLIQEFSKEICGIKPFDYIFELIKAKIIGIISIIICDYAILGIYANIKVQLLKEFVEVGYDEYLKNPVGRFLLIHYEKAEAISTIFYNFFHYFFSYIFNIYLRTFYLLQINNSHIFNCVCFSVFLNIVIYIILTCFLNVAHNNYTKSKSNLAAIVSDEVSNTNIVKSFNMEDISLKKVKALTRVRRFNKLKVDFLTENITFSSNFFHFFSNAVIFLLYYYKYIKLGIMMKILINVSRIHSQISKLFSLINDININFYIYYKLESMRPSIKKKSSLINSFHIHFKDVHFDNVFNNLNFIIKENEKIALYGKAGKSLILKALAGLVEINGDINIGDSNIKNIKRDEISKFISFISQDACYTNGTILENLKYGNNLTDDQVFEKCKEFGLYNFFESIDRGFQKHCSTGGKEISGGQRQRVHIARGIFKESKILLVDDCFFSISEYDSYELIKNIINIKNKTIIITTNNKELLKFFDKVLYLNEKNSYFDNYNNLKNKIN